MLCFFYICAFYTHMDKRERAQLFRDRLAETLDRQGWTQSRLSQQANLDRSTISQLLGANVPRLPNGHALGQIAAALQVSSDWLLGLTAHRGVASEILEQAVQMTEAPQHPVDEQMLAWSGEALGSKIRHVPAGLPDIFKNEDVLTFEYENAVRRTPRQAITDAQAQMALLRRPEMDMEIAVPMQRFEVFAQGAGQWRGLSAKARRKQLETMAENLELLYPSARLYAFDALQRFSVPFSVYGQQRVAIYVGQRYLAFTATRYIQLMARHFDDLVRSARVHAHEAPDWLSGLAAQAK
jgi:transcriptional regulator with XRE-family HTH domain